MNRLREEAGEGPVGEKGLELIRRTPGTPEMPEMKRRVWAALQQSGLHRAAAPRRLGLRAFAAGAVVLALGGTAGAVIARRWILPRAATVTSTAPATPVRINAKVTATRTVARAAAPVATLEAPPPPAPVVRARPVRATPPRATDLPVATAAERTQVLDAMIALRRDHDAVRAGRLLAQYLGAHPHGALREEALALAIEAANARGDAASARRWAGAYGDAYPNGRFSKFARETLQADAP
jgi:hypothetical protein